MPQTRTSNTQSNQPASGRNQRLNKHLLAYVATAGAAGVGMLAMTPSAEAKIVYTPTNRVITSGSRLDLNSDGIPDYFFHGPFSFCGTCSYLDVIANKGNRMMNNAQPLASGVSVGPNYNFRGGRDEMINYCTCSGNGGFGGPWLGVQNEYMGFQFNIQGVPHFGWARFSVTDKGAIVLTGYAYETISLKPIVTGDTGGDDRADEQGSSAAPELRPTGLGRLALGAVSKSRQ
jgi:hypothetical protein